MHIGFSLVDLAMGGAQVFFVQLASGLAERGHDVSYRLVAVEGGSVLVEPALKSALDTAARQVKSPRHLWPCDVIHLDGYHSPPRKLAFLPRWRRCVETYHSRHSVERAKPLFPPHRVAVSEAVAQLLPPPTQVIYQGLQNPRTVGSAEKSFDVAIVGRIHPVKNHGLFLSICETLYKQRGSCSALLIGDHPSDGPYRTQIDDEVERLRKIGVHFELSGNLAPAEVPARLSKARVLLVTSHDEGFGRMALEAMACGVPVVASATGGLTEIIDGGENGILVEPGNVPGFVAAVVQLLDSEALYQSIVTHGRHTVQRELTFDNMVSEYEDLYRKIADKR